VNIPASVDRTALVWTIFGMILNDKLELSGVKLESTRVILFPAIWSSYFPHRGGGLKLMLR
jgi:hypothetical protein